MSSKSRMCVLYSSDLMICVSCSPERQNSLLPKIKSSADVDDLTLTQAFIGGGMIGSMYELKS
jgi:hypothetical protein